MLTSERSQTVRDMILFLMFQAESAADKNNLKGMVFHGRNTGFCVYVPIRKQPAMDSGGHIESGRFGCLANNEASTLHMAGWVEPSAGIIQANRDSFRRLFCKCTRGKTLLSSYTEED